MGGEAEAVRWIRAAEIPERDYDNPALERSKRDRRARLIDQREVGHRLVDRDGRRSGFGIDEPVQLREPAELERFLLEAFVPANADRLDERRLTVHDERELDHGARFQRFEQRSVSDRERHRHRRHHAWYGVVRDDHRPRGGINLHDEAGHLMAIGGPARRRQSCGDDDQRDFANHRAPPPSLTGLRSRTAIWSANSRISMKRFAAMLPKV